MPTADWPFSEKMGSQRKAPVTRKRGIFCSQETSQVEDAVTLDGGKSFFAWLLDVGCLFHVWFFQALFKDNYVLRRYFYIALFWTAFFFIWFFWFLDTMLLPPSVFQEHRKMKVSSECCGNSSMRSGIGLHPSAAVEKGVLCFNKNNSHDGLIVKRWHRSHTKSEICLYIITCLMILILLIYIYIFNVLMTFICACYNFTVEPHWSTVNSH